MSDPVLIFDGVWKAFARGGSRISVLEDVSITVHAGETVAVVGKRDEGKSTLLRIAAGLVPVDRGSVRLDDLDLAGLKDAQHARILRTHIGLAARTGPRTDQPVQEYVALRLTTGLGLSRQERELMVTSTLARLDVADCAQARWTELSNWQRVRVELAQAIVTKPKLLLIDDILDGLGLGKTDTAMELIRDLAHQTNCGVLMVASDDIAPLRCDTIWKIATKKLKLMAQDTNDDLLPGEEPDYAKRFRWHVR